MEPLDEGARVRIDIPDETDPDHELHGEHGTIVDVIRDDAGKSTGSEQNDNLYRIELESKQRRVDVRSRDLRPPIDD